ncbi:ferredoxin [Mycobacterium decipiens]|uniref:Ferredoxin n=1 Tax=Mycobacterium decipiens TaxID=1430326 RepID=A0A1X2LR20_9MYCO|nr:(4Fe-4S)-binding protein [Mycobacterium decipiens]OSC38939.1 ferredoxin [Mycobacterium decipiens]
MKVRADREICMAAGVCVMTADAFFDQDAAGIVLLATDEVPAREEGRVRNAVRLCPSGALELVPDCGARPP